MKTNLAQWSLILLSLSMAGAFGGGLYEHIVLMPIWSASPPTSFSIIQRGTGVPLQRFWVPVQRALQTRSCNDKDLAEDVKKILAKKEKTP